jgi:Fe(3+) dicitrate transport protein
MNMRRLLVVVVCFVLARPVYAQESSDGAAAETVREASPSEDDAEEANPEQDSAGDELLTDDYVVQAQAERAFQAPGSVHVLTEERLEELDYNDPLMVLQQVPGVYVRQEEGFGLRPNIGLRGANAERSRKITLLEDGVLMAPAPYSAPAAYYFPLVARMTSVEVTMGPSAILHGPNSIGGAIDFRGRAIPTRREGRIDLAMGNTWYGRVHLYYGDSNEWGGFIVEALHLRSSGFRELDEAVRDDDTGFHRTDIQARADLHGSLSRDVYHRLELTLGLGLEESNETYLGLTDQDYRATPYRRYAATQLDHMEWWRTRVQLRYELDAGDDFRLVVTGYRHDFERTWQRLDRFCTSFAPCVAGPGFDAILADPTGSRQVFYEILSGQLDTTGSQRLLVVQNHRTFVSQGVQATGSGHVVTGDFTHHAQFGVRLHYDEIVRDHTADAYEMRNRRMVLGDDPRFALDNNFASTVALSAYATWAVTWRGLTITPGVRTELIWMHFEDRLADAAPRQTTEQMAFLPGIGAQYAITSDLAVFGGAHLGYSPVAPGQPEGTLPETAWNYEVGARYGRVTDLTHAQATFFLSDYQNIVGQCSFAGGCSSEALDAQYNGGAALISGIEAEASHTLVIERVVQIPLRASYTWTWSRFQTSFMTENPQLREVREGDRLPYVPEHQLSAQAGVIWDILELHLSGTYVSAMRDTASHGPVDPMFLTDEYFMLDATASVEVTPGFEIYLRGENLTDARPLVSRRPWGARSGKPLLVQAGLRIAID